MKSLILFFFYSKKGKKKDIPVFFFFYGLQLFLGERFKKERGKQKKGRSRKRPSLAIRVDKEGLKILLAYINSNRLICFIGNI